VGPIDAGLIRPFASSSERDQRVRILHPALNFVADLLALHVLARDDLAVERANERKDQLGNPAIPVVVAKSDEDLQPALRYERGRERPV